MSELSIAESIRQDYEDEIKRLNKENEHLRTALNTKENFIKELREYIKWHYDLATDENVEFCLLRDRLLKILEKVVK